MKHTATTLTLAACLAGAGVAHGFSEQTLFDGVSSELDLLSECPLDNSRIYSFDWLTWVETRGDKSDLEYVCISSEVYSSDDAETATERAAIMLGNVVDLSDPYEWLAGKISDSIDAGCRSQTSRVGGMRIVVDISELAGGAVSFDVFIYP